MENKNIPLEKREASARFTKQQVKALRACYDYLLSLPDPEEGPETSEDAASLASLSASSDSTRGVEDSVIIAEPAAVASVLGGDNV